LSRSPLFAFDGLRLRFGLWLLHPASIRSSGRAAVKRRQIVTVVYQPIGALKRRGAAWP
jgi:hypothetical protein